MSKVYVLGAGASYALNNNAPQMKDLLRESLTFSEDDPTLEGKKAKEDLRNFIVEFYGYEPVFGKSADDPLEQLPPFEDMLSQVDYCIANNMPLSAKYSVDKLRHLRTVMVYALGRVIQKALERGTKFDLIESFLNHVKNEQASIISLNYDLIIDNGVSNVQCSVDYGIPIRNNSSVRPTISLYKLHGSLNWLYCPVCHVVEVTDGYKGALGTFYDRIRCSRCKVNYAPILVTPSFLKEYSNGQVLRIWQEAESELYEADEIVFIGYSMPDADIILRLFFTRALFTNRLLRKKRRDNRELIITVVNWFRPTTIKPDSDEKRRYRQLFGDIRFDPDGFDEYIRRGCTPDIADAP